MSDGREWVVEAFGCDPASLTSLPELKALFDALIQDLGLHPVAPTQWHQFPAPGGITGLALLSESHLACHTFPEHQSMCLNLFCCRIRPDWDFQNQLQRRFHAERVRVRRLERPYCAAAEMQAIA